MTMPADLPPSDPNAPPVGDPPEPPVLGEGGEPGDPDGQPPDQRTVPVAELIKQRTKYRGRENWLKSQIEEKDRQIARLQGPKPPAKQLPTAPPSGDPTTDAYTKQLMSRLGLDKVFDRMEKLEEKLATVGEMEQQFPQVKRATELAMNNYFTAVQNYAASQHDPKTMPISLDGFLNMVAGGMTPEITEAIYEGNNQPYMELVASCKKQFKSGAPAPPASPNARDAAKVKNLPNVPGPGGTPPGSPPEKPLTGRPLHHRAAERFMQSVSRGKGGGTS